MAKIIPAILAKSADEFLKKLALIDGHADEAQIDIMDGEFVPETTFQDPAEATKHSLQYELHLMVEDPLLSINKWKAASQVRLAIIHAEIAKPLAPIIQIIQSLGWKAGVALNPETPWQAIDELIPKLHTVLVMTVHPGKSGQLFAEAVTEYHLLAKITELHTAHPGLLISSDGGINPETLPHLLRAGVRRVAVGSAIFGKPDPVAALQQLQSIAHNYS